MKRSVAGRVSLVDRHLVAETLPHHLQVSSLGSIMQGTGVAVTHRLHHVTGDHALLALAPAAYCDYLLTNQRPPHLALHQSESVVSTM